jgi:hypothetical protein
LLFSFAFFQPFIGILAGQLSGAAVTEWIEVQLSGVSETVSEDNKKG